MERNHLLMLLKLGKNYCSFTSRNYQAYTISYTVRDWLISYIQLKFRKKNLWKNDGGLSPSTVPNLRADFQSTKQGLSLVDSWSRGLD